MTSARGGPGGSPSVCPPVSIWNGSLAYLGTYPAKKRVFTATSAVNAVTSDK